MSEIHASTKPYPAWWTDGGSKRASVTSGESASAILERNICFVDSPGVYSHDSVGYPSQHLEVELTLQPHSTSPLDAISTYLTEHISASAIDSLEDLSLLKMLEAGGGSLVDAVFYLISPSGKLHRLCDESNLIQSGLQQHDVDTLRELQSLTNIIPLLARVDTVASEDLQQVKTNLSRYLTTAGISTFSFSVEQDASKHTIFSVSALQDSDDTMDASILMDSNYLQPLVPTDLSALLESVFCPEGSAWLRHSAAKKCLSWRRDKQRQNALVLSRHPPTLDMILTRRPCLPAYELDAGFMELQQRDWAAALRRSIMNAPECQSAPTASSLVVAHPRSKHKSLGRPSVESFRQPGQLLAKADPLGLLSYTSGVFWLTRGTETLGWRALELARGLAVGWMVVNGFGFLLGSNFADAGVVYFGSR